ncbi:hypothetical protein B9Z55_006215 [Caenorhabditis nigoni]|uniref:Sdz-33 F-box domain-containing protein n=1 Tax=Caenorhabditis nigoni TaxID=1611254 RepID=A0A2G5V452_9PELO|nr:hypothetical protein B9Z55_006215 [Caenorhabditis nigoni]
MAQLLHCRYLKEIDGDMYLNYVSIEEVFSIYSSLSRIFSCPAYDWFLLFGELKLDKFWEYTERILTTELHGFVVDGGSISNESLAELMEKMPEKANIIIDSDISLDYSNPKAFNFRSVEYKEARWLKIENLFSIRNSYMIKLKRTNFDCSDVNQFIHYWSGSDKDMMEEIRITLKEGTQIDTQEITKDLIVIHTEENRDIEYFIKATNIERRKFVVGRLKFSEEKVIFTTYDLFKHDALCEYLVLKLVHQKKDCEEKIRRLENEFRGLRDAEKRKFQVELEELEAKLEVLNCHFVI